MLMEAAQHSDIFYALAEPKRRSILEMLASTGTMSATEISENFEISSPAVSQHLKVLRDSDLVRVEKRAQHRIYSINPERLHVLEVWAKKMSVLWDEKFR